MTQETTLPRQFGKIILTLENCLLSDNKLQETPSHQDGLDKDVEMDLRILGCELIQIAGILLKLPQVAMATGQVLFQRFYYSKSYLRHNMETTAMSCVCLASKIEEAPRRIRDVINVFHHIKQVRGQKPIQPMVLDTQYVSLKNQVIKAERRVLKELGFCVHVKHPHKLIVMYLQVLGYEKNQRLMQLSWNFMNDSLRTDVFVRYNPESIACACIYLSARKISLPLPSSPPWFGVFSVSEDDILDIAYKIMDLYRRPKPNAEKLDQSVEKLKKKYEEIRLKSKAGQSTPPSAVTTVDRNDSSHNAWGGFIARAVAPVNTTNDNGKLPTQPPTQSEPIDKVEAPPQNNSTDLPSNNSQDSNTQQNIPAQTETSAQEKPFKSGSKPLREQQNLKRSHSRSSRSRSRSRSRSASPTDNSRSRTYRKSRRSRTRSRSPTKYGSSKKKSSRNYSRSPSGSPSKYSKKRDREKSDYSNGDRLDKKHSTSEKHRSSDYDRSRRDRSREKRYSSHNSRSSKYTEKFRDRKR